MKTRLENVQAAIHNHESLQSSYLWNGDNGNGQSRGRREGQLNYTVTVEAGGHVYGYTSHVTISRKRFYYKGLFTKDGQKHDVRLFKKLQAQLESVDIPSTVDA